MRSTQQNKLPQNTTTTTTATPVKPNQTKHQNENVEEAEDEIATTPYRA
jgi:hypothetical protein